MARCWLCLLVFAFTLWGQTLQGAVETPHSPELRPARNLFSELLGRSPVELKTKLDAAWAQLFMGKDADERLFYPVGKDQGFIADIGNGDVRSEGMSYGLMIAVQMDQRDVFDRLWTWAKVHMYHASGERRGYFAWQCRNDGSQIDPGSASDGEEWMAMALLFASHRWGDKSGRINYGAEAQALLDAMLDDDRGPEIRSIFNLRHKQVVFAPTTRASRFTDPSYHLPAFYELWARWDKRPEQRKFWKQAAAESRAFFRRCAHPRTGLMPEYSEFNGAPRPGEKGDFRFDAWRTPANVAMDHAWFQVDPWQKEQSNRVLRFFLAQGPKCPNQFTLDGKALSEDSSLGLFAMAAVAGHAADAELARPFVQRLWDAEIPSGRWRYYDGLLYFLALLQVSGEFRVYEPPRGT